MDAAVKRRRRAQVSPVLRAGTALGVRVALVCGTYARRHDGVADYTGVLAGALAAQGVDAVVGSAAGGDDGSVRLCERWDARGVAAAARALAGLDPDLVHVQYAPSAYGFRPAVGALPLLLRRRGGPTVVTTLHEYGWWSWPARVPAAAFRPLERRGWWDRETGALGPRSAALVTTNPGHASAVRARLGREPHVVPLGPNVPDAGWDRVAVRADVRHRLGLPPDAVLLAFFGFVHPVKGVGYLLSALALLRARRPDGHRLHLVVVGGFTSLALPEAEADAFRDELAADAASAGVRAATTVTGHLPSREASRFLAAADVAVLPFTAGVTTKSGSLLAAWAHGLPVVATAADEPDGELRDGEDAVLVAARRDAAALAAGIARLLDDDSLRGRVAAGGAVHAAERSWDAVADAHLRLYAAAR